MLDRRREQGAASLLALAIMGMVLLASLLAASCLLLRGMGRGLSLLDDERRSPLYCKTPPDLMLGQVPPALLAPGGSELPCWPRRLDYAALGDHRGEAPEAFCSLLRAAHLPLAWTEGSPCT